MNVTNTTLKAQPFSMAARKNFRNRFFERLLLLALGFHFHEFAEAAHHGNAEAEHEHKGTSPQYVDVRLLDGLDHYPILLTGIDIEREFTGLGVYVCEGEA